MAVSVMIRRKVIDTDTANRLAPLIVQLRSLATKQPGYVTGRTFRSLNDPSEFLVMSTWHSLDDWNRWWKSDQRMQLQKEVNDLLGEETNYRVYESLAGGIIP